MKKILKQEILLRNALKEVQINLKDVQIKVDHLNGYNYINGYKTGIIYPKYFFEKGEKISSKHKSDMYFFNGDMHLEGKRKDLLAPFIQLPDSHIEESNFGRISFTKGMFNYIYFNKLGKSKFGLCPHQADWPGLKENMWTYRFIEACMVYAIPVLFRNSPLGKNFISKFYYVWDDEIFKDNNYFPPKYIVDMSRKNFETAQNKFTLNKTDLYNIGKTL